MNTLNGVKLIFYMWVTAYLIDKKVFINIEDENDILGAMLIRGALNDHITISVNANDAEQAYVLKQNGLFPIMGEVPYNEFDVVVNKREGKHCFFMSPEPEPKPFNLCVLGNNFWEEHR